MRELPPGRAEVTGSDGNGDRRGDADTAACCVRTYVTLIKIITKRY